VQEYRTYSLAMNVLDLGGCLISILDFGLAFGLLIPEFARLPAIESVALFPRIDTRGCVRETSSNCTGPTAVG